MQLKKKKNSLEITEVVASTPKMVRKQQDFVLKYFFI